MLSVDAILPCLKGNHTIERARSTKSFSSPQSLCLIERILLRRTLVRPIDLSTESLSICRYAGDILVVESGSAGFNDSHGNRGVLGQSVCDDQARSSTADDDVVVSGS